MIRVLVRMTSGRRNRPSVKWIKKMKLYNLEISRYMSYSMVVLYITDHEELG